MKGGRKGQGIALNTIVIAAIAILILVLVVAFASGALGKLFGGAKNIGESLTPDQVATFRIGCKQSCFSAQQLADTEKEWNSSDYCNKHLGNASSPTYCWNTLVGVECSKNITKGNETIELTGPTKCQQP